ncbi:MAG: metallophosphoesterase [Rubrivivax sp.]|nr:metallophosphoesterase [Rubrivivax sp.]
MRLQLLSDLHLESEAFDPEPAPRAEVLVLAGDIDSTWDGLARFRGWPVPVLFVAGNHEFDGRELDEAWPALRAHCAAQGITLLERECLVLSGDDGRRIRFAGTVRWSDFEVFGPPGHRDHLRALRAAGYFQRVMRARLRGAPFDALAVREQALACRDWLQRALVESADGRWDATVAVTHFAPSLRSADPRYGRQPGTASFCNADDALLPGAALWLHGHLHCRHDYIAEAADGRRTRVVSQARGLDVKGESEGFDPCRVLEV